MARPVAAQPKVGGNRGNAGKGRPKGSLNKATADIKALAAQHVVVAMKELARLAVQAESEAARVAAIKELFDRGYGKSTQLHGGDPNAAPIAFNRVEMVGVLPA